METTDGKGMDLEGGGSNEQRAVPQESTSRRKVAVKRQPAGSRRAPKEEIPSGPAAPRAAPKPAGPPPTTSTSVSAAICAFRGGKSIILGCVGLCKGGMFKVYIKMKLKWFWGKFSRRKGL